MVEQLSLRLEPALPRPGDLAPMWPVPCAEPFDSSDHLFEPAWGGHRVLAYVDPGDSPTGGGLRLVDGGGLDVAGILPELAGLAARVGARSAVLDAELAVVDGRGRADDEALRARLAGEPGRPVALLVFDLLHLDGRWLLGLPLEERRARLTRILRPGDEVVMVPAIIGEGRALHAAVSAQGVAGVRARRRTSPYLPGVRSKLWRTIPASAPVPVGDETGELPSAMPEAAGYAAGPVLALFLRLPLDEPPAGEP